MVQMGRLATTLSSQNLQRSFANNPQKPSTILGQKENPKTIEESQQDFCIDYYYNLTHLLCLSTILFIFQFILYPYCLIYLRTITGSLISLGISQLSQVFNFFLILSLFLSRKSVVYLFCHPYFGYNQTHISLPFGVEKSSHPNFFLKFLQFWQPIVNLFFCHQWMTHATTSIYALIK